MEANFKIDQQLVKTVGWVAKIDFDIAKKKSNSNSDIYAPCIEYVPTFG